MLLTATATSTSLKDLIVTAWYDLWTIEAGRMKQKNSSNNYWIYLLNKTWGVSIFIDNLFTAVVTWMPVLTWEWFPIDIEDISNFNVIVASWTQEFYLIIS